MSCESSILNIADFILGEVEVSQIGEPVHGGEVHSFQLVLIQSQVMDRVVDVLGDRLIWWLVLTADSQPHIALIPLNEPAVPIDHVGKEREDKEGGENTKKESGGGRHALHDADEQEEKGDVYVIKEGNGGENRRRGCVCRRKVSNTSH